MLYPNNEEFKSCLKTAMPELMTINIFRTYRLLIKQSQSDKFG